MHANPSTAGLYVPVSVLQLSHRTLTRLGIGADAWAAFVAASTGVDPREDDSRDALVEFPRYLALLQRATALVGAGRLLRWYLEDTRLMQLGPVGAGVLTAPTLGASIDCWLRHAHVLSPVLASARRDTRQDIVLTWRLLAPLEGLDAFYLELVLLNVKQQLEYIARAPGAVQAVFEHAPVAAPRFYEERFAQGVSFCQGETRLVVPRALLAQPNESHVPLVWKDALAASEALARRVKDAVRVSPRVREALVAAGLRGCAPTIEEVAGRLGMSSRTLARRLNEEGTSFRDLQGHSRIEYAMRELRQTNLPIKAIGLNAGFSNFSAFSRAFRKLADCSPSEYRATT